MPRRLHLFLAISIATWHFSDATTSQIRMPGVVPEADSYLCTSLELSDQENYLTGFKALTTKGTAHHILLFGCEEPGSDELVWDCGEMNKPNDEMPRAPTCGSKPAILYAWALDAPPLELPKDVGFQVGGYSNIRHLVMQVHYMHSKEEPDETGLEITHTEEPQPKLAATMLLVTGGTLPANKTESFETACMIEEDVVMHPFAYRTHTHRHGKEVSGWLVKEDQSQEDHWKLIGRRDPQLPQMFVPVEDGSMTIQQGDMVTARCVMANNEDRDIPMGATGEDEMCNFYVMYWTDGEVMRDNTCYSPGAPNYRWGREAALNHIPK
ncbi:Protein CBR-PGHM-1 [Caenorhabditis briggsae]|uniref:peptidylglycine monooxygenase n=1 Tax=Caenorhabditis briggsae TaxID=6238 RepID=A8Y1S2_CAEBR|nr:Protein CBR-PGHM-1 [Caenorhabditis briggsae]CAP38842.1 Protein CBR-PGHM-1 [Caenorhabditis briggsae]